MLRRFMTAMFLFSATATIAQGDKITEKQPATAIDYKLPGAPMPALLMVAYHGKCTGKNADATTGKTGGEAGDKPHSRKRKTETEDVTSEMTKEYITNKELDNQANLFVMMFNPTCSHCEDMTSLLEKNMSLFKRSKIVLVATKVMTPYLPDFIKSFHIDEYPQMHVGTDSMGFIDKVFLYSALPQINIYDSQRKLLKIYTGDVEIDSLKRYIE